MGKASYLFGIFSYCNRSNPNSGNWILFFLIPLYWLFMTFLMKNTEEKWLIAIFGKEYEAYKDRTNR